MFDTHLTTPYLAPHSDAGWSSLVARRAHNPKVVGSNPAPATIISWLTLKTIEAETERFWLFLCPLFRHQPTRPEDRRLGLLPMGSRNHFFMLNIQSAHYKLTQFYSLHILTACTYCIWHK
jgi:hypothetical protein